jgi:DNA invertase Pin-like site-specific DNA recombinase
MIYGFARVSADAQDLSNQVAQLKAAGYAVLFCEKISGTTAERSQLKKLMAKLAADDVVVIPAVDRLSPDTTDLLVIARDMQLAGAARRSIADPVVDTTSDFAGRVVAMLGVADKLERRRTMERNARGRADAKAKGVKFGRKPILTPHQQNEPRKRIDAGETQHSVARSHNVSEERAESMLAAALEWLWDPLETDDVGETAADPACSGLAGGGRATLGAVLSFLMAGGSGGSSTEMNILR